MNSLNQNNKQTVRNLAIFTFLVIALGWIGWLIYFIGGDEKSHELGLLIFIISPIGASFLLRAFAGDGWNDLGIKPGIKKNILWYTLSILVYPVIITLVLVIGSAFGAVSFPDFSSDTVGLFIQAFAVLFLPYFFKNIFEEFGWRGYLAPKMLTLGLNDMVAHLIVGIIWAVWHLPYYLGLIDISMIEGCTTQSLAMFIPFVIIGITASSIVYGEIRIRTDSVWPAVLMHSISNVIILCLILDNYIEISSEMELLFTPGMEGVLSIIFITMVGVGLYLLRKRGENNGVVRM